MVRALHLLLRLQLRNARMEQGDLLLDEIGLLAGAVRTVLLHFGQLFLQRGDLLLNPGDLCTAVLLAARRCAGRRGCC